eukprot:m.124952 g.124952  ORF g.124952 m.124952 type:complete len:75 (+) comp14482_c0_seq18:211-435(+)
MQEKEQIKLAVSAFVRFYVMQDRTKFRISFKELNRESTPTERRRSLDTRDPDTELLIDLETDTVIKFENFDFDN